jgi:HTH-type transcriptional regulator/antitoxin HigA
VITNERQYRITKSQLEKMQRAHKNFDLNAAAKAAGPEVIAKAKRDALESEIEVLERQVKEYETLQSGVIETFEAASLAELPQMLIKARIAQHLSQKELAVRLGVKEQQIQRYESEEYAGVSLHRLKEIADVLKLTIWETAQIAPSTAYIHSSEPGQLALSGFPIREMYKRGWFEDFTGSQSEATANAEMLIRDFIAEFSKPKKPLLAFPHRSIRSSSHPNESALLAWEYRVLHLASKIKIDTEFSGSALDSAWLHKLVQVSCQEDGPVQAKEMLRKAGIPLVIEPQLTNTLLDGTAILGPERPVIGMTIRYDRLDNFWFVLIHELVHVIKHLQSGKIEAIFDDLEAESNESIEREADTIAEEILIPIEKWKTALPRYVRTEELVKVFAEQLGISPSIVAGRIRFEAKNYTILNDLIGHGEARKHFPHINFGV